MALRSQISGIVANQVGRLQGELEAKIQQEAFKLANKFTNECPSPNELVKIAKTRNNLLKTIINFQKILNRFSGISSKLRPPITVAKIIISLLKQNPRPSAIIVHPGGTGVSLGKITTLSDRLRNAVTLLEALEDDVSTIDDLLSSINPSINNIRDTLEFSNVKIQECVQELEQQAIADIQTTEQGLQGGAGSNETSGTNIQTTEQGLQGGAGSNETSGTNGILNITNVVKDLLTQIQPPENIGPEGTPNESFTYRGANGKDYTLAIIEDRGVEGPVPRRVAVAKDNIGVIVLRGQPSFSSDTQVLLDELKFRIDNQLP